MLTPNSLGQSTVNPRTFAPFNAPDTDSRLIKIIDGSIAIYPNLAHDHTRLEYIVPSSNAQPVNFYAPVNTEARGLHYFILDNSNNLLTKSFIFSADYKFLDDAENVINTYNLAPGQKLVWFCTFTGGKLYMRISSESTN